MAKTKLDYKGKKVTIDVAGKKVSIEIDGEPFDGKLMDMEGGAKWVSNPTYLHRATPTDLAKDIIDNWTLIHR